MRLCLLSLLLIASAQSLSAQNWIDEYFERVAKNQAEQPHWVTPVATVTPRLEQEIRYDIFWQQQAAGYYAENYGGSKGLELIPADNIEVIVNLPPYLVHNNPKQKDGWGDESFLLKYRVTSRNEESGNYILTAFIGWTIPTGTYKNGSAHAAFTPTLAGGKGWGKFDVQTTAGDQPADRREQGHRPERDVEPDGSISRAEEAVARAGDELHLLPSGPA
jgi:hypothetical protein